MKIYESDIHRKLIEQESKEINFFKIGLKIKENILLGSQRNSTTKFGQNDENFDSQSLITYLIWTI